MSDTITIKSYEHNYDFSLNECESFDIDLGDIQPTFYTNYTPPMGNNEYEEYLQTQMSTYEIDLSAFEDMVKESAAAFEAYAQEYITVYLDDDCELGEIMVRYNEYTETKDSSDDAEKRYNAAMKLVE